LDIVNVFDFAVMIGKLGATGMVLIQNPVQPFRSWYSDADNSRYN